MPSPAAQRHHMSSQRRLLLAATLCVVAVAMGAAARLNGIAERSPRVAELEARIARRLEHNRVLAHELGLTLRNASPRMAHARALEFYSQQLQPAGVELLVFRHDSLLFWSSNIDLPPDTTDGPARLLRYSSCRFLAQSLKLGQGLYGLMLSRFYMDYPYQNDLLHNGLCAGYRCMEGYAPSRSQSYGAVPIEPQGMERFYMVPTDLARLSTMPAWVLWMQWAAALLLAVAMSIALSVKPIAKRPGLRLAATTLGLVGLRAISMWADVPATQGSRLFDPELFAHNALNPSLGDFFVNSLVAFTIIALLYNFTATRAVRWPLGQSCPAAFVAALAVWGIFGIADLADRPFLQLSSGEQRLVLLARAFVKDPQLLILDEPLHGLDLWNRRLAKDVIETFCQRPGKTMIMVTHYQEELPDCITDKLTLARNL